MIAIVSGKGDGGAVALLEQAGVKVVIGVVGDDPRKAVEDYIKGDLEAGQNVCDH